jgi:hypothetical protein
VVCWKEDSKVLEMFRCNTIFRGFYYDWESVIPMSQNDEGKEYMLESRISIS